MSNGEWLMSGDRESIRGDGGGGPAGTAGAERVYDLKERTALFGESMIRFAKRVPANSVTSPLITQLVKSGTSVGANYCEADDAESRKDFLHKIGICTKEANESKYWLRMVATATPDLKSEARTLWQEAKELHLIFAKIFRSKKTKPK